MRPARLARDTGVVAGYVDPAVDLNTSPHHALNRGLLRDVAFEQLDLRVQPVVLDQSCRRFQLVSQKVHEKQSPTAVQGE